MDDTAVVAISTSNHRPWIRKMANAAVKRRKRRSRWRAYDCTETVARIAAKPANETLRNTSRGPIYRSEEHTSELQSRPHLVCRLLLEKKKKNRKEKTTVVK